MEDKDLNEQIELTIEEYYMIKDNQGNKSFSSLNNLKKLAHIYAEKFDNPERYTSEWLPFMEKIKQAFPLLEVVSETLAMTPCYSGYISLFEKRAYATHRQGLYFHVSLLGNYYTLYGQDEVSIHSGNRKNLNFAPIISISPRDIYTKYFETVREMIEKNFQNHRFIPYRIWSRKIPGLYLGFLKGSEICEPPYATIYHILFFPEEIPECKILGDIIYPDSYQRDTGRSFGFSS